MHAPTSIAKARQQFAVLMVTAASETDCLTVAARLRCGDIGIAEPVYELRRTELGAPRGCAHNTMTELRETTRNVFGDGLLQQQRAIQGDFPAWRIGCGLRILPVVDEAYHNLQ